MVVSRGDDLAFALPLFNAHYSITTSDVSMGMNTFAVLYSLELVLPLMEVEPLTLAVLQA